MLHSEQPRTTNRILWIILLIMAGLYFVILSQVLNFSDFFVNDTGVKFIQVENLVSNQWQSFAVEYPMLSLDPEYRFSSLLSTPFFYSRDGQVYGIYSNAFTLLSSLFYAVFGFTGLGIMSILFTSGTMWVAYRLSFYFGDKLNWLVPVAIGLLSPLLFYTLEFYEYPITCFFSTLSLLLIFRAVRGGQLRYLFGAGMALGMTVWFRPESYALVFAIGLASLTIKAIRRIPALFTFGAGGAAVLIPLWIWQYLQTGHLLGANFIATFDDPQRLTNQWETINLLLPVDSERWTILCAAALLGRIGLQFVPARFKTPAWMLFMAGIGGWLAVNVVMDLSTIWLPTHFIRAFPVVLLVVLLGLPSTSATADEEEQRGIVFLVLACLLHVVGVMVTTSDLGGTGQWGPRYLSPLYPILIIVGFFIVQQLLRPEIRESRLARSMLIFVAALFALTGVVQAESITYLQSVRQRYDTLSHAVRESNNTIVTDLWWYAHITSASLPENQHIFLVDYNGNASLPELLPLLADHDIETFALVTAAESVEQQTDALEETGWVEADSQSYPIWDGTQEVIVSTYHLSNP